MLLSMETTSIFVNINTRICQPMEKSTHILLYESFILIIYVSTLYTVRDSSKRVGKAEASRQSEAIACARLANNVVS
jgi:hypothetical protein